MVTIFRETLHFQIGQLKIRKKKFPLVGFDPGTSCMWVRSVTAGPRRHCGSHVCEILYKSVLDTLSYGPKKSRSMHSTCLPENIKALTSWNTEILHTCNWTVIVRAFICTTGYYKCKRIIPLYCIVWRNNSSVGRTGDKCIRTQLVSERSSKSVHIEFVRHWK